MCLSKSIVASKKDGGGLLFVGLLYCKVVQSNPRPTAIVVAMDGWYTSYEGSNIFIENCRKLGVNYFIFYRSFDNH